MGLLTLFKRLIFGNKLEQITELKARLRPKLKL